MRNFGFASSSTSLLGFERRSHSNTTDHGELSQLFKTFKVYVNCFRTFEFKSISFQVTNVGNATSSIATLILAASDDGKDLTCRATNPYIPGAIVEDRRTLSVSCKFPLS